MCINFQIHLALAVSRVFFAKNINLCLKNSGLLKWNCMLHTHAVWYVHGNMVYRNLVLLFFVCLKWAKWKDLNIFQILFIHFHFCSNYVCSSTLSVVVIVQIASDSTKAARCHFVIKIDNVTNTNTNAKSLA